MQELGEVKVEWRLFSVELANLPADAAVPDHPTDFGGTALQLLALAQRLEGNSAVGRLYTSLGSAAHVRDEKLADPAVLKRAWSEAGLADRERETAAADLTLWQEVIREHRAAVESCQAFGVPTLILDGGDGPGIFGPVITEVPSDEESRELLVDVVRMTRRGYFFELKRDRDGHPPQAGG